MKKRFLPFSLLLVIMILGQSIVIADNGGHYVPRTQSTANAESFMASLRANQHTGLIDPALMIQAMQSAETKGATDNELYWLTMGPDNMGGQTTAVLYDNKLNPNTGGTTGVVYIGSKGGGVYKSYNYGVTWHQVGSKDLMVSCMVQDVDGTIYVGTGDGNSAATYNGLDEMGYDNSFVGSGIYMIGADDVPMQIASTAPSMSEVTEWSFVNDLAIANGVLLAATDAGLKYSVDKGNTWAMALEGRADEVKVGKGNTIVASVDGMIYIGSDVNHLVCRSTTGSSMSGDTLIPQATLLDVAIAPTNDNVIYASCIGSNGKHSNIYVSGDKGATWKLILPATDDHNVYGGYGLYNHGMTVNPTNEGVLYIWGYDLWKLEKPESGTGFYLTEQISSLTYFYQPNYVHVGLHCMVFCPYNVAECYVGTDGGVFKGTYSAGSFTFSNCNRNYVTMRVFSVGVSGTDRRILAAGLDHGVVRIDGSLTQNTVNTGTWINPLGYNLGLYDESAQAGPCAFSNINDNTIFVTYKNGDAIGFSRSETAGDDWASVNFTSHSSISLDEAFRIPILLHEDFEDELNPATVWFFNTTGENIPAGTEVQCISNNEFPFNHILEHNLMAGDSIEVQDPISARMYVGCKDAVYTSRTPLDFSVETVWYELVSNEEEGEEFAGTPLAMTMDADGENLFVGTVEGKLYRFMGETSATIDSVWDKYNTAGTVTATYYQHFVTIDEMTLPVDGQCVTSVAIDPRDANKVVVTLGNYGNTEYVLYSTNALSANPTFASMQGNLPKMPVYSSVIEMATGKVIIGTERGIYTSNGVGNATWTADGYMMGEVPVMELKQQLLYHEDEYVVLMSEEDTVVIAYPGVHNTGIIYAATYGKGAYRCENYKQHSGTDIPEGPAAVETRIEMYPNPVRDQAIVSFDMENDANVSYQVYDMMGRLVMNRNLGRLSQGQQQVNVNLNDLSTGSYILRLTKGTENAVVKFLVY